MEAGYDYTLIGERPQGNSRYLPAMFVAVLAGVLLISGLAYYGFASNAQADQVAVQADANQAGDSGVVDPEVTGKSGAAVKYTRYLAPASLDVISGQQLYPAGLSEPEYWVNPLGYEQ